MVYVTNEVYQYYVLFYKTEVQIQCQKESKKKHMYNFEHSAQVQMQSALRHRWQVEKIQKVLISIFPRFGTNPKCKLLNIFYATFCLRSIFFNSTADEGLWVSNISILEHPMLKKCHVTFICILCANWVASDMIFRLPV